MTSCPRCGVKIDPANSAQPTCRACGLPLQGGASDANLDMSNEQTIQSEEFFPEQLPRSSPPTSDRTIEFQSQEETPPDQTVDVDISISQLSGDVLPGSNRDSQATAAGRDSQAVTVQRRTPAVPPVDSGSDRTIQLDDLSMELPGPTIDAGTRRPPTQPAATIESAEFELEGGTFELATPPADQSDRTLEIDSQDDSRLSQTIQSDEFSVDNLPSGPGNDRTIAIDSQDDPNLSQTIQSEEFSAPRTDRTIALTADVNTEMRQVASPGGVELDRTMATVWAESARGDVQENMTIKGAEFDAPSGPTGLKIGERTLGDPSESKSKTTQHDYELMRILGQGGMGVVYDARQRSVDRNVALKMLKANAAGNERQQQKFLAEAVVTGDLDHPNIVPIYDVGRSERGLLFYAMKKVSGTPWMKALPQKSTAENIGILMKVADALAFAHSRGVIHRDLKPENIMLGDFGEVLVMDWGLALPAAGFRKTASITANHAMGGTPAYMAPEMATGPMDRISFKSDIYLMGAILFEILTGKAPHTGKNTMACLQNAARNEIRPTDKTGELMDIAFKAMATDPSRRYQTVTEFQEAIRQYQSHAESILLTSRAAEDLTKAAGTSDYRDYSRAMFGYEEALALWDGNARAKTGLSDARERYARCALGKGDFDLGLSLLDQGDTAHETLRQELTAAQNERNARVRRLQTLRRLAIGMAAAMFVIVTGALFWINAARSKAVAAEKDAREQKDFAIGEKNKADRAREGEESARKTAESQKTEATLQREFAKFAEAVAVDAEADAVDARIEAEQSAQEAQEARTKEEKARIAQEYEAYVAQIGLASSQIDENAFDSARAVLKQLQPELKKSKADLRDWEWGRLSLLANRSWNTVNPATRLDTVVVSPDGTRFVTGGWNGTAQIWDAKTGVAKRPLPHTGRLVHGAAWSPDGRRIITVGSDKNGRIRVWNAESGELEKTFDGHTEPVLCVAFFADPDSRRFVTGSADNSVRLWDLETGDSRVVGKHNGWVWSLAVSPDRTRIASAGQDGAVILWPLDQREPTAKFLGHTGPVYAVAYSPDGQRVASGGHDKNILIWDPRNVKPFDFRKIAEGKFVSPPEFTTLAAHQAPVRGLAFSSKTGELASAGQDNVLCLWNIETGESKETYRGHGEAVRACAFDPTGRFLFSASYDGTARVWNRDAYESDLRSLADANLQGHRDAVLGVRFSGDGKKVITASRDHSAKSWNVETGKVLNSFEEGHEFLASNAVFTHDGKRLFTAGVDNTVLAWNTVTGLQLAKLDQTGRAAVLAISGDGSWLLTGSDDDSNDEPTGTNASPAIWNGQVWYVRELKPGHPVPCVKTLPGHKREISAVAFSPRQTRACTADSSGKVIVWNTSDWSVAHTFSKHVGKVTAAIFLDEETLLTASLDKTVARWNLVTGEEVNALALRHPDGIVSLAIDKDRHLAITACNDGAFRMWDLDHATETTILARGSKSNNLSVDIRSGLALTADSGTREIRLWNLETGREVSTGQESSVNPPFLKLPGERSQLWTARFTPDGGAVLSIGGDESRLWDSRTARPKLGFSPTGIVASAAFSHSGELVVTGSGDNSARIWNANTGIAIRKLAGIRDDDSGTAPGEGDMSGHSGRVNSAVFSPDDTLVLTAGEDRVAILWNAETGTVLRKFRGHRGGVRSAQFSFDGKRILTASSDKTARVWEVHTGREIFEPMQGHTYALTSAVFSPDGRYIATGSEDTTARIWNAATGVPIDNAIMKGHTAAVTSLAFLPTPSADRRKEKAYRLVTGSFDNTAKLWDPLAGKEILTLRGHTQEVTSLDVSADGRSIVTGSRDGSAILWRTADWVSTDVNQLGYKSGPAAVSTRN